MNSIQQQTDETFAGSIFESWAQAFANLRCYIVKYNEDIAEAKRANKPLEPEVKTIKSSVARTAEHILRIYLHQLSDLNRAASVKADDLPPFRTYTPSLASSCNCTDRTIQNHRKLLKTAGIVLQEENHGAFGLRIWINPQLFLKQEVQKMWKSSEEEKTTQKEPQKNAIFAQIQALKSTETKSFHPLGHDHQDLEKNISNVDMLKASVPDRVSEPEASEQDQGRTTGQGKSDPAETPKETPTLLAEKEKKSGAGGGGGPTGGDQAARFRQFAIQLTKEFWMYAKLRIYPHQKFHESDERIILRLIWRNIFNSFPSNVSTQEYEKGMVQLKKRIDMAENYFMRNPGFVPLSPDLYFGDKNITGSFYATAKWYIDHLCRQEWNRISNEANRYRSGKFFLMRKGNKYQPTIHQIFARHIQQLELFGDAGMLERFKEMVAKNPGFYAGYKKK